MQSQAVKQRLAAQLALKSMESLQNELQSHSGYIFFSIDLNETIITSVVVALTWG